MRLSGLYRRSNAFDTSRAVSVLSFSDRSGQRTWPSPVLVAISVLIGTAFVVSAFPIDFLAGTGAFWSNPRGFWLMGPGAPEPSVDLLVAVAGYVAFLHQPWSFPLVYVSSLGAPLGTNLLFLASIPIVSLLGKLALQAAGHAINPFGLWVAACFVLNGVLATLCVIELGQRNVVAAIAATLLAITAPPLLFRFGHLGIMAHWLILGALYLYLRDRRDLPLGGHALPWAGWLGTAFTIDIYLTATAGAIFAASMLRRFSFTWRGMRNSIGEGAIVVAALLVVGVVLGYFGIGHHGLGKGTSFTPFATGFGKYSMNLVSPIWPQMSGIFPGFDTVVDATTGQYEGFNYFGAGALLLIAVAVWRGHRYLRAALSHHLWLLALFAAFFLFSLSDRVFAWNYLLADYRFSSEVDWLAGLFRSSGRFFWPIFYCTILYALVLCLRTLRPAVAAAFVAVCCLLQLIDTSPLRERMTTLTTTRYAFALDRPQWQERTKRAAAVFVSPSYQCGGPSTPNVELSWFAAEAAKPINSIYNPRRLDDCGAEAARVRNGPHDPDTLYVLLNDPRSSSFPVSPTDLHCENFTQGIWCLGRKVGTDNPIR